MFYIDTHAHLNFKKFNDDSHQVILDALNNDIAMIIVGSDYKSSRRAVDLANHYEEGVYAAVGLHPSHLDDQEETDEKGNIVVRGRAEDWSYENYEKLAVMEKVVAIGEIGLDYYHLKIGSDISLRKKKQQEIFREQLLLARKLNLPAIIHCRNAHDDLFALISTLKREEAGLFPSDHSWGVLHCFSGDEDLAWKYFNLGLMISFTGLITFSSLSNDLIRKAPLDKIMIETDCPYLTPEPYRGKRNEPLLVPLVAKKIAEIRGVKLEKIAEATTENAKRFFNI